jgi:hypothetical protein
VRAAVSVSGVAGTATGQLSFDGALRRTAALLPLGVAWNIAARRGGSSASMVRSEASPYSSKNIYELARCFES